MNRGAFDAMDEDFFRRGEMLAEEEVEDFSDLDDVPAKPMLGLRLPTRPARSKRFLAVGTPPPERIADVAPRAAQARRRARVAWRWTRARRTPIAVVASALLLAVVGMTIPGADERTATAGNAVASLPERAVAPAAAPAPSPEPVPMTAPATRPAPEPAPAVTETDPEPAPAVTEPAPAPEATEAEPAHAVTDEAPPVAEPAAPAPARASQPRPAAKKTLSKAERRERAAAAYAKGRKSYMAGNFTAAARYFRTTVKTDPSYHKGYRALGLTYRKSGDSKRAARALRTYLRKSPRAKDRAYVERLLAGLR